MSWVLCSVSSVLKNRRSSSMIPLGAYIDASLWQAIATWSQQVLHPDQFPTLTGLLTATLPTSLRPPALLHLQQEVSRIPPESLEGSVSDGFAQLSRFLE